MARIYYAASNNGDGSSSVHFFKDQEAIDFLKENDLETFGGCEGGSYFDTTDENLLTTLEARSFDEVKADWEEWN